MNVTIQVSSETPGLDVVRRLLRRPRAVTVAAAGGVAKLWRQHFLTRNQEGNQKGWPSSNFFAREGKGTVVDRISITDTTASILVPSRPLAFRMRGGTIRPGPGKRYLAIPATAEAYKAGMPSARDGGRESLAFALARHPDGGWRPALVRRLTQSEMDDVAASLAKAKEAKTDKGRAKFESSAQRKLAKAEKTGRENEVQYWLVRKATIAADPRILPPDFITELEAVEAARDYVTNRLAGASATADESTPSDTQ